MEKVHEAKAKKGDVRGGWTKRAYTQIGVIKLLNGKIIRIEEGAVNMGDGRVLSENEERLAAMLRATTVALGCALIDKAGEEEAATVFHKLMEKRVQAAQESGSLGKGLAALATMVLATAPYFGQEITFDLEGMTCRVTRCGLWEAGKEMGYKDTPLCIRCKANSDTVLKYVLPGYKKRIHKRLWTGDEECYMTYYREGA